MTDMQTTCSAFQRLFRGRRMRRFWRSFEPEPATTVLDIGGTPQIWRLTKMRDVRLTLLNLEEHVPTAGPHTLGFTFKYVQGNALGLPFVDREFDITFSNSVIEHVGDYEDQRKFADEARRVGVGVWIQTPARFFPVEPHFVAPFVHYVPAAWRPVLVKYLSLWSYTTRPSDRDIRSALGRVRLVTRREMQELFPDCVILTERFFLLPKAFIAFRRRDLTDQRRASVGPGP